MQKAVENGGVAQAQVSSCRVANGSLAHPGGPSYEPQRPLHDQGHTADPLPQSACRTEYLKTVWNEKWIFKVQTAAVRNQQLYRGVNTVRHMRIEAVKSCPKDTKRAIMQACTKCPASCPVTATRGT